MENGSGIIKYKATSGSVFVTRFIWTNRRIDDLYLYVVKYSQKIKPYILITLNILDIFLISFILAVLAETPATYILM